MLCYHWTDEYCFHLLIGMRNEDGLHNFHEGDFNIFFSFWQHAFLVLAGLFSWVFSLFLVSSTEMRLMEIKTWGTQNLDARKAFLAAMPEPRENGNTLIQPNYQLKWLCTAYTSLQQQRFTNTVSIWIRYLKISSIRSKVQAAVAFQSQKLLKYQL